MSTSALPVGKGPSNLPGNVTIPGLGGIDVGAIARPYLQQAVEQIMAALFGALVGGLGNLFKKRTPPAEAPPQVAPPVVDTAPGGQVATIPQAPVVIPAVRPAKKVAAVRMGVQGVEKPQRVGGGPGVNYEDFRERIASGSNFNSGCVVFCDSTPYGEDGHPFEDAEVSAADLEFRTEWRVYKAGTGELVAFIKGEGDDNPGGEGKPLPYHQSVTPEVHFGISKWEATDGFGLRIVLDGEGVWEIEQNVAGVASPRVTIHTS